MVNSSRFPPNVGRFDLTDGTRGVENKDLLRAEFSVTHGFSFSPYHRLNLSEVSLAEKGNARRNGLDCNPRGYHESTLAEGQ